MGLFQGTKNQAGISGGSFRAVNAIRGGNFTTHFPDSVVTKEVVASAAVHYAK